MQTENFTSHIAICTHCIFLIAICKKCVAHMLMHLLVGIDKTLHWHNWEEKNTASNISDYIWVHHQPIRSSDVPLLICSNERKGSIWWRHGQFVRSEEKELSQSRLEKEAALTGETTLLRNFQPVSDLSDLVLYVIIHSQAQSFWFSQTQMFTIPLAKHILVNVPGQQHPYFVNKIFKGKISLIGAFPWVALVQH